MSTQNGRPGSPIGYTGPIVGYGSGSGSHAQHPLQSPKTQHINAPPAAPASPGSHTLTPIFQQVQRPTTFGSPIRTRQPG